ncbi:MAG: hypothetical protein ACLFV3_11720 [Phycisphaeraceae bacterium]
MVDCQYCGHRYAIGAQQVRRRGKAGAADPAGTNAPADEAAPTGRERCEEAGRALGLSGLSDIMRREAGPPAPEKKQGQRPAKPTGPPTAAKRKQAAPPHDRRAERHPARKWYLLLAGVAVAVVLAALAVLAANSAGASICGDGLSSAEALSLPLVRAERLDSGVWRPGPPPGEALVEASDVAVRAARRRVGRRGAAELAVRIASGSVDLIESGRVRLTLVSSDGRALAWRELPVTLLSSRTPQRRLVPLPPGLAEAAFEVRAELEVDRRLEGGVRLEVQEVREAPLPRTIRQGYRLRVLMFNRLPRPMQRVVLQVVAVGHDGRPVARWRGVYRDGVPANQRVELQALLPKVPEQRIAQWRVEAAGY